MAIVQISRIQHRRGVADNLPQLAVGELGLAVDTRRIYIGNGGTDAPKIENIELLTASSDLLDSADTYTYKGAAAGYNATTGVTANNPITRTMQQKYDDHASIKDFGAIGDGTTDDTAAINRALFQLFSRASNTEVRRALFFPAGTYVVTDVIKIPTFAKLVGDGHNSSIIKATNAARDAVAMTSDSIQQIDGSVGSGGATVPGNVHIDGMTFFASVDTVDALVINQAQNVTISNCRFQGFNSTIPGTVGNSQAAVKLESSSTRETEHVNFVGCVFTLANFGVVADNDMSSITFSGCEFSNAFKGAKIGEARTGSAPSVDGPRGVKITNSLFDNIHDRGIHGYFGPGLTSAFNSFKDVANAGLGVGNASTHVIDYAQLGQHSIGDDFERTDGDVSSTTKRVNHQGFAVGDAAVEAGRYSRRFGTSGTITNNQSNSNGLGVSFSSNSGDEHAVEIDYTITRGTAKRQGVLRITQDGTAQVIDDDFSENNGTTGVTFSLTNSSNITTLLYTSTSTGTSGTMQYSIRTIS